MGNKFHGVFSLVLAGCAFLIAVIAVTTSVWPLGLIYIFLILVSLLSVVYFYCSKCDCKDSGCGHIFPGLLTKLLAKVLPPRKPGAYNNIEYAATYGPLALIILFPQVWLLKEISLFILFWLFIALAALEIRLYVCKGCQNKKCPLCIQFKKSPGQVKKPPVKPV